MKFELFIARRLSFKGDNSQKASPSINIAVAGTSLAIVIMMIAIAVILGFKHEIREKVVGFDAQITVSPITAQYDSSQEQVITLNDTLLSLISEVTPNAEISLAIKQPCILKTDDNFMGVVMKGMDTRHNWEFVSQNLVEGDIPDYTNGENTNKIIISKPIASKLNLKVSDKIYGYYFLDNNIRPRRYEIAAIYESHFGEYDQLMVFCNISSLQKLNNIDNNKGSHIEIRGLNINEIDNATVDLISKIYNNNYENKESKIYNVENIFYRAAIYFNWLNMLDMNVIVILILMAIVSCFTLISSMFIIILERVNMIGVMKAMGSTDQQLQQIFINMTQRLVIKGLIIGNIIGLSILLLQSQYHILPLDPESYYLSYVPVKINALHIILLNMGVIAISYMTLILPSKLVAKINPAQTIKYE